MLVLAVVTKNATTSQNESSNKLVILFSGLEKSGGGERHRLAFSPVFLQKIIALFVSYSDFYLKKVEIFEKVIYQSIQHVQRLVFYLMKYVFSLIYFYYLLILFIYQLICGKRAVLIFTSFIFLIFLY
jgi:hypothetical protein